MADPHAHSPLRRATPFRPGRPAGRRAPAPANDNRPSATFVGGRIVLRLRQLAVLAPLLLIAGALLASALRGWVV